LDRLKKFKKLKKLIFSYNNLNSLIQLSKLENLTSLTSLNIENNEVSLMSIFKSFIVYRFPQLIYINDIEINENDRKLARIKFLNFDKILSNHNTFTIKVQYDQKKDNDSKNKDKVIKRNIEYANNLYNEIIIKTHEINKIKDK